VISDKELSIIMHEVRTPLTKISGASEILQEELDEFLSDEQREILSILIGGISDIKRVTTDFLDMYRNENLGIILNKKICNTSILLNRITKDFSLSCRKKGINIHCILPENAIFCSLDYNKMKQVLTNVVNNSLKYTTKGFIALTVEKLKDSCIISIRDTGSGLSKEDEKNMFKSLYRSKNNKGIKGTGIGLEISRQIVNAHDGGIWAESISGMGCTIKIKLPLGENNEL
jgi:signal transduction histidine kinase